MVGGLAGIGSLYVLLVIYGLRRDLARAACVTEGTHLLQDRVHVLALLFLALSLVAAVGYIMHFERMTPNVQSDPQAQWRFVADYDCARLIAAGLFDLTFMYLAAAFGLEAVRNSHQRRE